MSENDFRSTPNGHRAINARSPSRDEAALRASEARYRRLFETAKDGIFLLDAESGRIVDVNPFLSKMLGYSRGELIGKMLWEIGPVKDIQASQEALRHLQDEGYIRYDTLPLQTKSKKRVKVEFVSNVYHVEGVRVIQCNVRDITARKMADDAASRLNRELQTMLADMRRRDGDMTRLNEMNDLLHASATQVEAFQVIALMAGALFVGHSGFLAMLRPPDGQLDIVARWGGDGATMPAIDLNDCWAMRRGRLHAVRDPREGLVCRHFSDHPADSYLCIPLSVQGETLGLLCLLGSAEGSTDIAVDQPLAVSMGESIKLSISNLRLRENLREQSILDVLTGLYNRRFLDESLPRELHRSERHKSPLCLAMLDLDHFKLFNDKFGHEAGDSLLRTIGQVLRDNVRKSDFSCRHGGEEFVLVFPDSSLEDTARRVEKIRALVGALRPKHDGQALGRITLTAGIAQALAKDSSAGELLRAADNALYAAKRSGRDRVFTSLEGAADAAQAVVSAEAVVE